MIVKYSRLNYTFKKKNWPHIKSYSDHEDVFSKSNLKYCYTYLLKLCKLHNTFKT